MHMQNNLQRGFTLTELIITVGIMSIVISGVGVLFRSMEISGRKFDRALSVESMAYNFIAKVTDIVAARSLLVPIAYTGKGFTITSSFAHNGTVVNRNSAISMACRSVQTSDGSWFSEVRKSPAFQACKALKVCPKNQVPVIEFLHALPDGTTQKLTFPQTETSGDLKIRAGSVAGAYLCAEKSGAPTDKESYVVRLATVATTVAKSNTASVRTRNLFVSQLSPVSNRIQLVEGVAQ